MKKRVRITKCICDICEKETAYNKCACCGKDICYTCKNSLREFPSGVYFTSSSDGCYCAECDSKIMSGKIKDPLHAAYEKISILRREAKIWSDDFTTRMKIAEGEVEKLRKRK